MHKHVNIYVYTLESAKSQQLTATLVNKHDTAHAHGTVRTQIVHILRTNCKLLTSASSNY